MYMERMQKTFEDFGKELKKMGADDSKVDEI